MNNVSVSVRIPEELKTELFTKAKTLGISQSELVRIALESLLRGIPASTGLWNTVVQHQSKDVQAEPSPVSSGPEPRPIMQTDTESDSDSKREVNPAEEHNTSSQPSPSQTSSQPSSSKPLPEDKELPQNVSPEGFVSGSGGTFMAIFKDGQEYSNPPVEPTSGDDSSAVIDDDGHTPIRETKSRREVLETPLGQAFLVLAERRYGKGAIAAKSAASLTKLWGSVPGVLEICQKAIESGTPLFDVLAILDEE